MAHGATRATNRRRDGRAGVAAIEFALVFPVLALLFFGMIDLTHYILTAQKVNSAAALVADLVTRHINAIPTASVDDYFLAAKLLFKPATPNLQIDVYDYAQNANGNLTLRWQKSLGRPCDPPVINMNDPNDPVAKALPDSDVVVAVACMPYTAPVPFIAGIQEVVFSSSLQGQMALRPRQSITLLLQ